MRLLTHTVTRARRAAAATLAAAILGAGLAVLGSTAAPASAAPVAAPTACSTQGTISKTLKNGTSWSMCWNIDSKKGIVLEGVYVKGPKDEGYSRVLDSIALAQLNVPYDSGENVWNDITSYGFGNQYLQKLDPSECPDGELIDVDQVWLQRSGTNNRYVARTIPAICVQEVATGLSYRSHEQDWGSIDDELLFTEQGTDLVVSTVSKVDWYEYQTQYRFTDTGSIISRLGATGDISPEDFADATYGWPVGAGETDLATGHHHSAFWRVDFGIDGASQQSARYFDSEVTGTGLKGPTLATTVTDVTTEANLAMTKRRVYNVYAPTSLNADQHARGYDIEFEENNPYEGIAETTPELTFTQYNSTEEFASNNQNPSAALQSVLDYANGQTITSPVAWVNVGFHHQVRDEDQSPMPIHWQGFKLVARDFWAQNPLTPTARDCVNGNPGGQVDSTNACGHATGTSLSLSGESQQYGGTPVTASVTVAQLAEEGEVPAGSVSIVSGADLVVSGVPLVDGTASFELPATLAAGSHQLVAVFAPASDTEWLTSSSAAAPFTVTGTTTAEVTETTGTASAPAVTTTAFTYKKKAITKGVKGRVLVTVTGSDTGTVAAYQGSKVLGTATLAGGKATIVLPKLKVGKHKITVQFAATETASASTSSVKVLTVRKK
ncbi:Ig-like domain repeat protein [Nocardioides sp.]|uniref:copper amine oxidase n=1 Tax=Nocardioides sp. TaxID=35761 RepID=UPI0039E439A3